MNGNLERQGELASHARLARAAQPDQRDPPAGSGRALDIDQQRRPHLQRRGEGEQLDQRQVRAARLGLGDVPAADAGTQRELRDRQARPLALRAQAPAQFRQKCLAFHGLRVIFPAARAT
jgi:hypothetical protein